LFQNTFSPRCCKTGAERPIPSPSRHVGWHSTRLVVVVEGVVLCLLSRLPVPRRGAINLSSHWPAPFSLSLSIPNLEQTKMLLLAFLHLLVALDGMANTKKYKKREATFAAPCTLTLECLPPRSHAPCDPSLAGKGGGWKGGKASCSGTPIRSVQDRGKGGDGDFKIQRHLPMQVVQWTKSPSAGRSGEDHPS
jgi:hypothetical protein